MPPPDAVPVRVRIHAPRATSVVLVTYGDDGVTELSRNDLVRDGDGWTGEVPEGGCYGLIVDGDGQRFDASKVLVDPLAREALFPATYRRKAACQRGKSNAGKAVLAVARHAAAVRPARRSSRTPVVYELHVRGLTVADPASVAPGTYRGAVAQLDRLAGLGVSVIELMPVHQSDPQEGSYWGYMPMLFGAVHRQYAAGDDATAELAELVAAAHERDIEVWLDVVFNHTTEVDETGPTLHFRGMADGDFYRLDDNGAYIETTGCGNDLNAWSPVAQDLVIEALSRFADLGVDGFRFDLAPILSRDPKFIERLEAWAAEHPASPSDAVRLIAEPWDAVGGYELGRAWPGAGWLQWNDRFRDDVRGFLRAESGLVATLQQRLQGSPDYFDAPMESVNFISCHDGFTMYDVVAYDRKHNEANGNRNTDGAGENRSWNCGWEGDDGAPDEVLALRQRQLRNAWCLLVMSHGVPMVAMGDEFGRTQAGNNNAYNQDNATSWVDWSRRQRFADLERFVAELLALRARHAVLSQPDWWGDAVSWFGVNGGPDLGAESRSLAWQIGDLYVIANAWWEPLEFEIQSAGPWRRVVDTSLPSPDDVVPAGVAVTESSYDVGPRSVVILER